MKYSNLLVLVSVASAAFVNNLNYASPSLHHPGLGISIRKVAKRHIAAAIDPSTLNFTHGVASGDPYDTSVILWTRVAPNMDASDSNVTVSGDVPLYEQDNEMFVAVSTSPICVNWTIAKDAKMKKVVNSGSLFTSSDVDYTLKVEATKLKPFTNYCKLSAPNVQKINLLISRIDYQFTVCDSSVKSPIGQTKTTPSANDEVVGNIRLAVFSCNNFPFGFFNALGNPVRKNSVDYVIFLGDYIYEYFNGQPGNVPGSNHGWGDDINRVPAPNKILYSLYDYRTRLGQYRTDLDLLASHARYPWIPVWDDHEVGDNAWKAGSASMNNSEQSFIQDGGIGVEQRKMNAVRAYFEWMPIRQVAMDDNLRIWRSFSIGTMFDLLMLDTRQYDRDITDLYWNTHFVHEIADDAGRSMMGARQEAWLYDQLSASAERGAAWRLVGTQTVFSRINQSFAFGDQDPEDYDAWGGYTANRNRTLAHLYGGGIGNNVFLAGDSHASWATDLVWLDEKPYDPATGEGAVGVEFAGSAVTSPCQLGQNITLRRANAYASYEVQSNAELMWQDEYYRGYYELSVGYDSINASYFGIPALRTRNPDEISLANFTVLSGENHLHRTPGGTVVRGDVAASGYLRYGSVASMNITNDTSIPGGHYFISS